MKINFEEIKKLKNTKQILTNTETDIVTPNLGKGFHYISSFHRIQFIAKTLEYMVYMAMNYGINYVSEGILLEAVCRTSWYLNMVVSIDNLKKLLIEMSAGLELLDIKIPENNTNDSKNSPINNNLFSDSEYKLSIKGWRSYQKQEYQILLSNLMASRISRIVSYIALFISFVAFFVTLFKK